VFGLLIADVLLYLLFFHEGFKAMNMLYRKPKRVKCVRNTILGLSALDLCRLVHYFG